MRQLLVTIHDVTPKHEGRIDRLIAGMLDAGVDRFGMLVVPDFWGEWPLSAHPGFGARLREWAAAGVEMWLHGWFHKDLQVHSGSAGMKAALMTAGEGEFLGLSEDEAGRRIRDGRALLEDVLGAGVDRFVAPAWLYSEGARKALQRLRFAYAEDHFRVWNPTSGAILHRGPVISYASRTPARLISSISFSRLATAALKPANVVRVALHPHDADSPALVRETARALASLTRGRRASTYGALFRQSPLDSASEPSLDG